MSVALDQVDQEKRELTLNFTMIWLLLWTSATPVLSRAINSLYRRFFSSELMNDWDTWFFISIHNETIISSALIWKDCFSSRFWKMYLVHCCQTGFPYPFKEQILADQNRVKLCLGGQTSIESKYALRNHLVSNILCQGLMILHQKLLFGTCSLLQSD